MHLVKPCTSCGVDTWQDSFETKDKRVLCGVCYITVEARNEGFSDRKIVSLAVMLYAPETVRDICEKAGIDLGEVEAVIAAFEQE